MVVCKFFQQGYCRFGQSCRFEHVYGSKYTYHASAHATAAPSEVTDDQLRQQVQADVQCALQGHQWPLSAYAPFKGKPNFPGLSDLSPDEARLFIYEAKANNSLDQAVAYMNNLQQEATAKYSQLLQPTPSLIKVFRTLYNGETPLSPFSGSQQTTSPFGSSTNDAAISVFRSGVQTNSVFGQNTAAPSIFGTQAASSNAFGSHSAGSTPAQSIFAQANQSVFGNNQAQVNPTSIFASASQKIFGSPTSTPFVQSQATSPFAQTSAQSPNNIFQKQDSQGQSVFQPLKLAGGASNSAFGQSPASVFAQANPDNFFGQKPPTSANVFGQSAPAPSSVFGQSSSTIFGQSKGNVFEQKASSNDSGVYSQVEELSAEDMEAFKSDSFTLGCIPELPPPHTLCV